MEMREAIRNRYSVRAYQAKAIPDDVLQEVLEAFVLAPTAANRQPIGLVVVKTEGREEELERVYRPGWFCRQPPLIACVCSEPGAGWFRGDEKPYADVDATIAMDHLILAATAQGLGTCWIGAFDPDAAREVFGLPDGVEPLAMTPLGYPADTPRKKLRKSMDQLVHYGRW